MRITSKGQVTIPLAVRERLNLKPHSDVEFVVEGEVAYVRKIDGPSRRGRRVVDLMRGAPLPDFFIGAHAAVEHLVTRWNQG